MNWNAGPCSALTYQEAELQPAVDGVVVEVGVDEIGLRQVPTGDVPHDVGRLELGLVSDAMHSTGREQGGQGLLGQST